MSRKRKLIYLKKLLIYVIRSSKLAINRNFEKRLFFLVRLFENDEFLLSYTQPNQSILVTDFFNRRNEIKNRD